MTTTTLTSGIEEFEAATTGVEGVASVHRLQEDDRRLPGGAAAAAEPGAQEHAPPALEGGHAHHRHGAQHGR